MSPEQSLFGIALLYERRWDKRYGWNEGELVGVESNGKPLKLLTDKTSRSIWTDGRIVVKVDRMMAQAVPEAILYASLEPEDRQFFAACLEVGAGYVVQEYVPLDKDVMGDERQAIGEHALALFKTYGLDWDWQGWAQFGVDKRTGMLVIHDYCGLEAGAAPSWSTLQMGVAA